MPNLAYKGAPPAAPPIEYRTLYKYRLEPRFFNRGFILWQNQAYQIVDNEYARHLFHDRGLPKIYCTVYLAIYPNDLYLAYIQIEAPYNVQIPRES